MIVSGAWGRIREHHDNHEEYTMSAEHLHAGDRCARSRTTRDAARRAGVRLDMTPLVDIAFLLLTFFICTSAMSTPTTMELRMPMQVAAAEAPHRITLFVRRDGTLFLRDDASMHSGASPQQGTSSHSGAAVIRATTILSVRFALRQAAEHGRTVSVVVKVDRAAAYQRLVTLLDGAELAERAPGVLPDDTHTAGCTIESMSNDERMEVDAL